jgi:hypothetical protein
LGALGIVLGCALGLSSATPAGLDGVKAIAREKAAAVWLLRRKAAHQIVTLANDRVFAAYLNATTQGEGARIRARIASVFKPLVSRAGIRSIALVNRSGEYVVFEDAKKQAAGTPDASDPVLAAGLAQAPRRAATIATPGTLTFATPVIWRDQREFVLSARQSLGVYKKVLARGLASGRFVALADNKGAVLCDTRGAGGGNTLVAGLTLDALRKALKGSRDEGSGQIARGGDRYNVSYKAVGTWTVVAAERMPAGGRCSKRGEQPCG